ncbi:PCI-domain protein (macronuclear) [Tetrahymena thermophila SB210]|uniref:PCI-domain protein n=1 Tax=Tetrahymena thermophila (strain SB210) TaxID=312017 RepID=Q22WD2_TETTS|nr:PCI-domain protein [Tetrahymena thermophila SB210]EAR89485.2 PCI-domain protein [Tetrahymena thermophila SB210]|eukprot:XP_001009730.2 PCI-domain protein [Tetrahymena thermophila SB210]
MSDYEYEDDAYDGGDYDDGGYDDHQEDDPEVELENQYYTAEGEITDDPTSAITIFQKIIETEQQKDVSKRKWTFKSLQYIIVISVKQNQTQDLIKNINLILQNMESVSRNDATDGITQIIESFMLLQDLSIRQKAFEIILHYLKEKQMIQLWFNASLKLAKIYFESGDFQNLNDVTSQIKASCTLPDGSDDPKKSEYLLEVYSIEIRVLINQKRKKELKEVYSKTKRLSSTINDPKIMAVIKETSGKMLMFEKNYKLAEQELLESFKYYQDIGNTNAKLLLKYVVLASILSGSTINPFDNKEAKVYKEDREIIAMQNLRYAYETKNINLFNMTIVDRTSKILEDEFMKDFIDELKRVISLEKITRMIIPYERIKISYISKQLQVTEAVVEIYLMQLILEKKINGYIDSEEGYFENSNYLKDPLEKSKEESIEKWILSIKNN